MYRGRIIMPKLFLSLGRICLLLAETKKLEIYNLESHSKETQESS